MTSPGLDADAARLRDLGYEQELRRGLRGWGSVAMGFATISPVVGLFAIAAVGATVAGPAWVWALPIVLAGQCLVLAVYAELASALPLANGAYQWSRRLVGPTYGWLNGWFALWGYAAANTTIAYLGAPWALALVEVEPTPAALVVTGALLVLAATAVNTLGIDVLRRTLTLGIGAEVVASAGVALVLLLAFTVQDASILTETLGAEARFGGSVAAALLAAVAVAGWAFVGFDAVVMTSEETRDAPRRVPKAIWLALLSVGAIVVVDALAATLAHPDPGAVVRGEDVDPVTTAVVTAFGGWATKPFAALVLVAFLACGTAAQGATARGIFSVARDGVLPASGVLRAVDARQVPRGALAVTTVIAWLGLLLAVDSSAIGSLVAFGTVALYVQFLLVALAALVARLRGRWRRRGLAVNALAVAWLAFETVNIAWPREQLAPPGAPAYQVWAAPLLLAVIAVTGLVYLIAARPQRRLAGR